MNRRHVRNRIVLLAIACVSLFAACTNKRPSDVLSHKKLEAILYDYHMAQSMVGELPSSERYKKDLYFDYVYAKHGITAAQLDSSLVYYARHPKELSLMYVSLSDRVERDIQRIKEVDVPLVQYKSVPVEGDSADLWFDAHLLHMSPSAVNNRFSTVVPYDTNFKANDSFEWSGEVLFMNPLPDSLYRYVRLALMVEYDNDSLSTVDTLLYTSGTYHLTIADTMNVKLRNVLGDVYYKGRDTSGDVLLYDMSLMRYRAVPADSLLDATSVDTLAVVP